MKILVVDDELVSRTKMMKILCEFGDCVASESGKDALVEFKHAVEKNEPFNLITLDISMADMSGIDVLKEMRNIEREQGKGKEGQAKVIMVTSHSGQEVVVGSVQAGCNNYILKPFDRDRIVDKLKSMGFIS